MSQHRRKPSYSGEPSPPTPNLGRQKRHALGRGAREEPVYNWPLARGCRKLLVPARGEQRLAPLSRILTSRDVHPEDLYQELLRLGGALCTFGLDTTVSALPSYDHSNLTDCFDELDQHIRTQLDFMVPTSFVSIPLEVAQDWIYEGAVTDPRCFGASRWVLAIGPVWARLT